MYDLTLGSELKVAFYVSGMASRLRIALERIIENHVDLLKLIAFIYIDNADNHDLRNICKIAQLKFYEENISDITSHLRGGHVSNTLLHHMQISNVSYLFCFGEKILKGAIITDYKNRMINFHPSILPSFKGLYAIDKALAASTFLLGNSAHIIDEGVDTGPVIMQSYLHNSEYQTYDDVLNLQIPMLIQLMIWIKTRRFIIDVDGRPKISEASYSISRYIPNLEI